MAHKRVLFHHPGHARSLWCSYNSHKRGHHICDSDARSANKSGTEIDPAWTTADEQPDKGFSESIQVKKFSLVKQLQFQTAKETKISTAEEELKSLRSSSTSK
jgi:hypothetical protein